MGKKSNSPKKIVSIFKNSSLFAIVLTATLIAILVSYIEYLDFSNRAEIIESEFIRSQKALIKGEVLKVTDYIELKRSQIEHKVKDRIKHRVYEAHAIASNIFHKLSDKRSDDEIKKLIIEALRPLRFFNGDGYYFINDMGGTSRLHAIRPDLEGKNPTKFNNPSERYLVKEMRELANKSGEGFVPVDFTYVKSQDFPGSKISFVKQFEPYNWFIGTGDYLQHVEREIQQEILDYIGRIRFGKNSYIFVVNYDGEVLMNASQKHLIGQNIWNLEDPNGVKVIQEERKAVENPEGDFIYYVWNKPSTSSPSPKVSFMKGVRDWQWMIGAGIYLDDAKQVIQLQRENLKRDLIKQMLFIIFISLLSSLLIVSVANKISKQFSIELGKFLAFFKTLSIKSDKIAVDSLQYIELRELANSANRMLEKQISIEMERIKVEESLRSSEASLKEAQRITHIGSWEYNLVTNKLIWSDEVYRIFEVDFVKTNIGYKLFLEMIHPDDRALVDSSYRASVIKKEPFDIEHRIKLKSGKVKNVREHAETFYDEAGNPVRTSGTIQDVTEKKAQEDKIKLKDEQLRRSQKMEALGKLTGGIAHDYNNMLSVISGFSELLLKKIANDNKAEEYVKHICNAAERGKELTDKLMTFSRYKQAENKVVDINTILKKQQALLEKTLTARINLKLNLANNLWQAMLDEGDLADAIINMAINTSHAIEASGQLTLTTCNEHLRGVTATAIGLEPGDYVSLQLKDTGVGMDSKMINQIFDPFFSTKGEKGTGLGLSQVYGFVQRSGGNITVESEPGIGTVFTLYFPRHYIELNTVHNKDIPPVKQTTLLNKSLTSGDEVILLVDDEPALCTMASDVLSANGYKVLTADCGEKALKIIETEHVDLMISDVIMPNMDGHQLATTVETDYPNIKIQLVSGFNEMPKNNETNDDLLANLLTKPYRSETLLTRVRELLDGTHLKQDNFNYTVMVMDDDVSSQLLFEVKLKKLGCKVFIASNAEQALSLYKQSLQSAKENTDSIDIVILDLSIPGGIDGVEVVKKLRALNSNVKFIVSSGHSESPVMKRYWDYGFHAALEKDFNLAKIENVLNRVCAQH